MFSSAALPPLSSTCRGCVFDWLAGMPIGPKCNGGRGVSKIPSVGHFDPLGAASGLARPSIIYPGQIVINLGGHKDMLGVGVFDGHSGQEASRYVAANLWNQVNYAM